MSQKMKLILLAGLIILLLGACAVANSANEERVILYSNADDEAVQAMEEALDGAGYEGKYTIQSFGTSELGGKIMAEGKEIEADLITMASYFLESAQQQNTMFSEVEPIANSLDDL